MTEYKGSYPSHKVADHEVFISFNGDDEAVDFRNWLDEIGWQIFFHWRQGLTPLS